MNERRQEHREESKRPAVLIERDGTEFPVQITDVSENGIGLSLHTSPKLSEDDYVRVKYRDIHILGRVRWLTRKGTSFFVGLEVDTGNARQLRG